MPELRASRVGRFAGVFPVLPTTFTEDGELDLGSQDRAAEFLIDAGVSGICTLANWSEQFALTDDERDLLMRRVLDHVAGRVPVIVTTSHFSTRIAVERCARAEAAGASMVMLMPPYHGATVRADEQSIFEFFSAVDAAISIPIVVQDAPMSGTELSVPMITRLARELPHVLCAKIEVPGATDKLRALVAAAGDALPGPWDGEEGITLLADLDAGATGTMPSAAIPDLLQQIVTAHRAGDRDRALLLYEQVLPLISYENRRTGLVATKALMKAGGVIASDSVRHPARALSGPALAGLLEHARRLDPLVLRWARTGGPVARRAGPVAAAGVEPR